MSSARQNDHQVEAHSSLASVDRLSKLPLELLQKIFDDAYATDTPTEPLSRTLLPLSDRCVWRDVKVVGHKRLVAFCAAFQTRPSVGRHCRSLKIEHLKSRAVSHQSLETVFANLPNLTKLVVLDDWEVFLDVLLPAGRQALFPFSSTIRHFACLCRTQRADPYNPAYLASLASMTGLTVLELIFQHQSRVKMSCSPSSGGPGQSLDSLRSLVQSVPTVKKLVIEHYEDPSSLAELILALASSDRFHHLVLHAAGIARGPLPVNLKLLPGLKTIIFRGDFSHLTGDSFDVLRALPLEYIEVGKKSDISAVELGRLVDGRQKLGSLKKLRLDNVHGKAGDVDNIDLRDYDMGLEPFGWQLPKWTVAFPYEDFLLLKILAGSGNVSISGTMKDAVQVEQKLARAILEREEEMYCDTEFDSEEEYWLGEDGCG
ncbi:hypothetical protein JCM10296v2_002880 [Rhodotorula toruloides]